MFHINVLRTIQAWWCRGVLFAATWDRHRIIFKTLDPPGTQNHARFKKHNVIHIYLFIFRSFMDRELLFCLSICMCIYLHIFRLCNCTFGKIATKVIRLFLNLHPYYSMDMVGEALFLRLIYGNVYDVQSDGLFMAMNQWISHVG